MCNGVYIYMYRFIHHYHKVVSISFIHTYIHTYIHTHIHTYIHTCIQTGDHAVEGDCFP